MVISLQNLPFCTRYNAHEISTMTNMQIARITTRITARIAAPIMLGAQEAPKEKQTNNAEKETLVSCVTLLQYHNYNFGCKFHNCYLLFYTVAVSTVYKSLQEYVIVLIIIIMCIQHARF
jgi:hypothetical protein